MALPPTPDAPDGVSTSPAVDVAGGPRSPPSAPGREVDGSGGLATGEWADAQDPWTLSTHSLVPPSMRDTNQGRKRTLLVVYIHGFMGNKASFRSFPAHVHSFLTQLLAETHVVHTKIYPRYKTYKSIQVARDNFSKWLAPHESPTTDVVLVGHSMGGLLAAEMVLLPNESSYQSVFPFRHRILGTISLDAPLLGLHPGIVVSGIASLFRPAPSPALAAEDSQIEHIEPGQSQISLLDPSISSGIPSPTLSPCPSTSATSSLATDSPDPSYDPRFFNDIAFVDRGWLRNALHFVNKHKEKNLFSAAANHIVSHLEFGACLADYPGMQSRYDRLRSLEDVSEWRTTESGDSRVRVRFVNYYTLSTGIPKKPKSRPASPRETPPPLGVRVLPEESTLTTASNHQNPETPVLDDSDASSEKSLEILEPMPDAELPGSPVNPEPASRPSDDTELITADDGTLHETPNEDTTLPAIPEVPSPPPTPDLDAIPDKELRKEAKKTFKLAQKAHAQAVKARDKALKVRRNTLAKEQKKKEKQQHKASSRNAHTTPTAPNEHNLSQEPNTDSPDPNPPLLPTRTKPPRLRKFCRLPSSSSSSSSGDPTWIPVRMEGVDEVGAHCGLFDPTGAHYDRLVGDVGERIADWVGEDLSRRVVLGLEEVEEEEGGKVRVEEVEEGVCG